LGLSLNEKEFLDAIAIYADGFVNRTLTMYFLWKLWPYERSSCKYKFLRSPSYGCQAMTMHYQRTRGRGVADIVPWNELLI